MELLDDGERTHGQNNPLFPGEGTFIDESVDSAAGFMMESLDTQVPRMQPRTETEDSRMAETALDTTFEAHDAPLFESEVPEGHVLQSQTQPEDTFDPHWVVTQSDDGTEYWCNKRTRQTSWDRPASSIPPRPPMPERVDDHATTRDETAADRSMVAEVADSTFEAQGAPLLELAQHDQGARINTSTAQLEEARPARPDWRVAQSDDGTEYWCNMRTREVTWDRPASFVPPRQPMPEHVDPAPPNPERDSLSPSLQQSPTRPLRQPPPAPTPEEVRELRESLFPSLQQSPTRPLRQPPPAPTPEEVRELRESLFPSLQQPSPLHHQAPPPSNPEPVNELRAGMSPSLQQSPTRPLRQPPPAPTPEEVRELRESLFPSLQQPSPLHHQAPPPSNPEQVEELQQSPTRRQNPPIPTAEEVLEFRARIPSPSFLRSPIRRPAPPIPSLEEVNARRALASPSISRRLAAKQMLRSPTSDDIVEQTPADIIFEQIDLGSSGRIKFTSFNK